MSKNPNLTERNPFFRVLGIGIEDNRSSRGRMVASCCGPALYIESGASHVIGAANHDKAPRALRRSRPQTPPSVPPTSPKHRYPAGAHGGSIG